jgi:hypothetical protein
MKKVVLSLFTIALTSLSFASTSSSDMTVEAIDKTEADVIINTSCGMKYRLVCECSTQQIINAAMALEGLCG